VLSIQKNEYEVGEEVKGEIQIISEEEFVSEKVAVSLSCWEYVKRMQTAASPVYFPYQQTAGYMDQANIYLAYFIVFNEALIPQGFNGKYPFTLRIPAVARETFFGIDHYVKWFVQSILTVKGRPRVETQTCEILVTKGQNAPTVSKEIIKEVVLIPCAYCGGLMPQASIFCPNCGARRKA
jgi:hypothetical protein